MNPAIQQASTLGYDKAVYNLAGDILINDAPDRLLTNSSITWLANVATVTTSAPHGLATGTTVVIAGTAPAAYGVTAPIIVTGASTYTYALTGTSPGSCTQAGHTGLTFFADLRRAWNITGFAAGVVQASSDVSTSQTLLVQDAAAGFTLGDLQNLKTPYGRAYLALAQKYGTLWGVT